MKKYIGYIVVFAVLLVLIPVLAMNGLMLAAKILGFVLIIAISLALRIWLVNARKAKYRLDSVRLNVNDRYFLTSAFDQYKNASSKERKQIDRTLGFILGNTKFDVAGKEPLTREDCLVAAMYFTGVLDDDHLKDLAVKGVVVLTNGTGKSPEITAEKDALMIDTHWVREEMKAAAAAAEKLNHEQIKNYLLGID
jgi:hypothetical protein